jgi:hypothetical protein
LSNRDIPNLIKIGKSDRDPSQGRADELYTTGVPSPFKIEYFAYVRDHHTVERAVHARLSSFRPNTSREFFNSEIAVETIEFC